MMVDSNPSHSASALPVESKEHSDNIDRSLPTDQESTWTDVWGYEEVKRALKETVLSCLSAPHSGARGVLLYGPSGVGKSVIARGLAKEIGCRVFRICGPELLSCDFAHILREAREFGAGPCVVVLDDFEVLMRDNGLGGGGEAGSEAVERLVRELNATRLNSKGDVSLEGESGAELEKGVLCVLGVTTRPDLVGDALVRRLPGFFGSAVGVGLPDGREREEIVKGYVLTRNCGIEGFDEVFLEHEVSAGDDYLEGLANRLEGFSGGDIVEICRRAGKIAVRRVTDPGVKVDEQQGPHVVRRVHFEEALEYARPSHRTEDLVEYDEFRKEWDEGLYAGPRPKGAHETVAGFVDDADDDLYI